MKRIETQYITSNHAASEQVAAPESRRGAAAVIVAFALCVLIAMAALSVDIAYLQMVNTEMQAATDAVAKASAAQLSASDDLTAARLVANTYASQNTVAGQALQLTNGDIEFGQWYSEDGNHQFLPGATPATAVRITGRRTSDSSLGPVPLFLAPVFGREAANVTRSSIAAFREHKLVLSLDRSNSMTYDLSGNAESFPPPIPDQDLTGDGKITKNDALVTPPHPTLSRWKSLRQAVDVLIDTAEASLQPPDIALVTWADYRKHSWYPVASPAVTTEVEFGEGTWPIRAAMWRIGQNALMGPTNTELGLDRACDLLEAVNLPCKKTVILMTDGVRNRGNDPVVRARQAARKGIVVHTVTFLATDYQEMQEVARVTGGRHYHASNAQELSEAFRHLAVSIPVSLVD